MNPVVIRILTLAGTAVAALMAAPDFNLRVGVNFTRDNFEFYIDKETP